MKSLGKSSYGATEPTEQCRTCKGSGKITRKDNEGIAVISYGDERLAPSRTAIYITIAVILFLALTGTFVVLFYPRTVSASSTQLKIVYANINMNKTTLILQDTITVKNTNYFVSHLDGIDLAVQYQQKEVGKNSTVYGNKTTAPSCPARKSSTLNYLITLDFTKETGSDDIWTYCCLIKYNLGFQVQVNSQFSYFSTNFGFSDSVYQNAMCNEIVKHPDNTCHLDLIGVGNRTVSSTNK